MGTKINADKVNPGFRSRLYKLLFAALIVQTKTGCVFIFVFVCAILFLVVFGFNTYNIIPSVLTGIIAYIAGVLLYTFVYVIRNSTLLAVLDKYGYGIEYLEAYEEARIKNKPFDLASSAELAEIYVKMGQPEKAVEYLGSIKLPENLRRYEFIRYISVYIDALLKTGNLEKAEDVWAQNYYYINRAKTIKNYSKFVCYIYLTEIHIECFAAEQGDENRLIRAYELTSSYMNPKNSKNGTHIFDFDFILLYELKKLGKSEEFDKLYPDIRKTVDSKRIIYEFAREMELRELEKAANGQLPFI